MKTTLVAFVSLALSGMTSFTADWLHLPAKEGTANGKKIVLVSGDEEYRTEETFPMLAKILSQKHGFDCTVLFAINPEGGYIDSNFQKNIPGTEALDSADLMIIGDALSDSSRTISWRISRLFSMPVNRSSGSALPPMPFPEGQRPATSNGRNSA
jgi:hypothetical protein